jgi:hypothetical protein
MSNGTSLTGRITHDGLKAMYPAPKPATLDELA